MHGRMKKIDIISTIELQEETERVPTQSSRFRYIYTTYCLKKDYCSVVFVCLNYTWAQADLIITCRSSRLAIAIVKCFLFK